MFDYDSIKRQMHNIYEELKTNAQSGEDIYYLYLEFLKLDVRLRGIPEFLNEKRNGNCYTYALDLRYPDEFRKAYESYHPKGLPLNPGFIGNFSSKWPIFTKRIIENFYLDCEALEIKVYESPIDEKPKHGGSKILFYIAQDIDCDNLSRDFHFIRQNADGTWSNQEGYMKDIKRTLPTYCDDYDLVKSLEIVKPRMR